MLTFDERTLVQASLVAMLSQPGDVKSHISVYFDGDGPKVLTELPPNVTSYGDYALYVVDICLRSGWSTTPSWMERLLDKLLQGGVAQGFAILTAALERVRRKEDPTLGYYDSLWVLRQQPFLNRRKLRDRLRPFIQKGEKPLLRINGPGAGRTYTKEFVDYLADRSPELHAVLVELAPLDGPSYTLRDFASDLVAPMGVDIPDPSTSSDAAAFSRFIMRTVMLKPGLWIFLLDGFGQPDLHPDVKALVQHLARRCAAPEFRKKARLILVNHSEPIPDLMPALIDSETIQIPSVSRQDLVDCLKQLNGQLRAEGHTEIDSAQLDALAQGIIDDAPVVEKERLSYFYEQLRALAARLRGQLDG